MTRQRLSTRTGKTSITLPREGSIDSSRNPAEIHISRQVDFSKTVYGKDWNEFANCHGEALHGDGITYALGSMAVTYVGAQEMGKMLSAQFTNLYGADKQVQLRKMLIDIHREFNQYIRERETSTTQILQLADDVDLREMSKNQRIAFDEGDEGIDITEFDASIDLDTRRLATNKLWNAGRFVVRGVEPYKNGMDLGLDLSHPENEALRTERFEIITDFLGKDQKLPVHQLDRGFDPHIVFFRSFVPVKNLYLPRLENPPEITLTAPQAIVNLRK